MPALFPVPITVLHLPREEGIGLLFNLAPSLSFRASSLPLGYSAFPFPDYTVHPVVPAKRAELVEVAKAMPREKFGAQVNYLFQWEKNAALSTIQTGEPRKPFRSL